MRNKKIIKIIQPDDWHVHLREGKILRTVLKYSTRINKRCIAMPNLKNPLINSNLAQKYKKEIMKLSRRNFNVLIPCYLSEKINLKDFRYAIKKKIFFGAKLYPANATTNSSNS